jgi:hypothetical protein
MSSIDTSQHRRVDNPGPGGREPVLVAHAISTLVYAAVGVGWVTLDDQVVAGVGTVVAFVLSTVAAVIARSRVSPTGTLSWTGVRDAIRDVIAAELGTLGQSSQVEQTAPAAALRPADVDVPTSAIPQQPRPQQRLRGPQ